MKNLENALIRQFGFLRYIGYEFIEEEDAFTLHLRPSAEKEWHTESVTDIHVGRDGYYTEMAFYVSKDDFSEHECFLFANKYNEGPSPVKLHIADAEDSFAIVGTMPNVCGTDPDFELDMQMPFEDALSFAEEIQLSVFYLQAYMDTVLWDFTGEEEIPEGEEAEDAEDAEAVALREANENGEAAE